MKLRKYIKGNEGVKLNEGYLTLDGKEVVRQHGEKKKEKEKIRKGKKIILGYDIKLKSLQGNPIYLQVTVCSKQLLNTKLPYFQTTVYRVSKLLL